MADPLIRAKERLRDSDQETKLFWYFLNFSNEGGLTPEFERLLD